MSSAPKLGWDEQVSINHQYNHRCLQSSIIFNWCLQSLLIMFRAKLVVMGPGFSQHGEVHLQDEDERRLEYKISFFKWQIEEAGYWCDIQRYVDWKYPQFGLSTSCWFLRAKSVDGFFIVVAILNQKFTCDISWTIWICANQQNFYSSYVWKVIYIKISTDLLMSGLKYFIYFICIMYSEWLSDW